ncbi:MAG: hypothetical protein NTY47_04075 [Candidatus Omnitrophica bacterium]|nr:hypothetical protein [Candidatus Omnitrophota bacterium]
MFKINLMGFILVIMLAGFGYCQERVQLERIDGNVADIDPVGDAIVVDTGSGQMTISVPDDVVVTRGLEKMGLMDLEQGEPVTVNYYSSAPGQYVAVSIQDNNNAEE